MTVRTDSCTPVTRIGYADPAKLFKQSDYKLLPYGKGGRTVASSGCTAVALANAHLCRKTGETPTTIMKAARAHVPPIWAPQATAAVLPWMARAAGFVCPDQPLWSHEGLAVLGTKAPKDAVALGALELSLEVCAAIEAGGFAWVCVDHTGDERGDHWLSGHAFDETHIYCMDSATGEIVALDRRTLSGASQWGRVVKRYALVRFYPLG